MVIPREVLIQADHPLGLSRGHGADKLQRQVPLQADEERPLRLNSSIFQRFHRLNRIRRHDIAPEILLLSDGDTHPVIHVGSPNQPCIISAI
jgi:hypothetical protein